MRLSIPTQDGIRLAATLYRARTRDIHGTALLLPATGSRQTRYGALAGFLADQGWDAVTFDYRGIGGSALPCGESHRASMLAWGECDLATVIDWARAELWPRRLVVVAHSIGGQIIPLAHNHRHIDAVLAVAAQKGHWRLWQAPERYGVWAFFRLYIPLCLRLLGQVPLGFAGLDDLPANVARDYARWTLRLDYRDAADNDLTPRFAGLRAPILGLSFADDRQYAPRAAVDFLMSRYFLGAPVWRSHLAPKSLGLPGLGHSGFFDPRLCPACYWEEAARWLRAAADGEAAGFDFRVLPDVQPLSHKRPLGAGLDGAAALADGPECPGGPEPSA